jgi:hypothetical protein
MQQGNGKENDFFGKKKKQIEITKWFKQYDKANDNMNKKEQIEKKQNG